MRPEDGSRDHRAIVADYVRFDRRRAEDERTFLREQPSLRNAIRVAALAKTKEGKRQSHQRRIPGRALGRAERLLQAQTATLRRVRSFAALHDAVKLSIGHIPRIGDLVIYDTAARIGAYLGVEPELVYLHAGTAAGARALAFRGKTLERRLLPSAFQGLKPGEVENCLCIYKDRLKRRSGKARSACAPVARAPFSR